MKTYQVSVNKENRVILDTQSHGIFIQEIKALTYEDARICVDTSQMYLDECYGWFLK